MRRSKIAGLLLLIIVAGCAPGGKAQGEDASRPAAKANWTLLVFINGDNNLEGDSLADFREMARVGSTSKVNVVVQHDRIPGDARTTPDWSDTKRFRITHGLEPVPGSAVETLGECNMGSPEVLREFITWGKSKYPAEHYMLVVWDHGQGYRARVSAATQPARAPAGPGVTPRAARADNFKSISSDDTDDHDQLYMKELHDAVKDQGLDVIGFDACLMGMVECAYALRDDASYMVGSEDLEPGSGWQYDDWVKRLVDNPAMTPRELAITIVDSYQRTYSDPDHGDPTTTLSAVETAKVAELANSITALADRMRSRIASNAQVIKAARRECRNYAPDPFRDGKDYFFHIDLQRFCEQLSAQQVDQETRALADSTRAAIEAAVVRNYAGDRRQGQFGSKGLAIYFPESGTVYKSDQYEEGGYRKENQHFPVAFVQEQRWADFLHAYFQQVP